MGVDNRLTYGGHLLVWWYHHEKAPMRVLSRSGAFSFMATPFIFVVLETALETLKKDDAFRRRFLQ